MASELLVERRGPTCVLTLSDPASRNSLSPGACRDATAAVAEAASDAAVRSLVLTGADGHFCAGGNLQRLAAVRSGPPQAQAESMAHFHGLMAALQACPKPVVAAVEGWAAGGGAALALACDLVVAAETARFVFSYGRIGLSPDGGTTWRLARLLPRGMALHWLWLPEAMTAAQWQQHGLVHAVVGMGEALQSALDLADRLARMAPGALASAKALIDAAGANALQAQLDAEREHFVRNLFHTHGGEGLAAFQAKRAARFD